MSPLSPSSQLVDALSPSKLRKDGVRLGLVAVLSIIYALVLEQPVVDVLLIGLNGVGALVGALALIVAFTAIRGQRRVALTAAAVYGVCTSAHVAAILLLFST